MSKDYIDVTVCMMNEQIVPFGDWLSNTILSANTDDES